MSTIIRKPKLSHLPDYAVLMPPGEVVAEKIVEMNIDVTELARQMNVPRETVQQLIQAEIPLTSELAEKLERATQMPADLMLRFEERYRKTLHFINQNPDYPVFR